jgi:putative MATE family efflux protein
MEIKSYKSYLIPSLIATLFLSTYVILDGFFIGYKLSDLGLSAINIGWPVIAIIHTLGIALGISAGIYISRNSALGRKDLANKAKLTAFLIALALAIIFSILIYILKKPLLYAFGADDIVYPYAEEYLTYYIFYGGIVFVLGPLLIQLLKNSGKSKIAMISSIVSVLLNLILDYIFIIKLDMGLKGAAFASVIGQATSFVISFIFYFKEFSGISFNKRFIKELFIASIAPYVLYFSYDIILIITNRVAGYYNGNEAIATYALLTYVLYIINAISQGIGDGIQPLFSYYSAKNDKMRLKHDLFKSILIALTINVSIVILFLIFKIEIATLYNLSDTGKNIFMYASIFYAISFILITVSKIISSYFYSTNKIIYANIIVMSEPLIFTPICYLLCIPFGFNALWWSYLIIQSLVLILSIVLYLKTERK